VTNDVVAIPTRRRSRARPADPRFAAFADFWREYPRKKAKRDARSAFETAVTRGADPQRIVAAVIAQRADLMHSGSRYCPYPATWLRDERWEDEADAPAPSINAGWRGTDTGEVSL
jgi:hypothetical protein